MDTFESLDQLRSAWAGGQFDFPPQINVAGLQYKYNRSFHGEFYDAIKKGINPYIVYTVPREYSERAREAGLNQWIVFLWGTPDGQKLIPYDVRTITSARGKVIYEQQETIGDVALLKVALPSGVIALKGKVDTGAEISSLHCDGKPKIVGDMVQFSSRNASANMIQAPLVDQQAVSSADGGTEYRPVIELDVEINGKAVRKAMFNLNDRSHMEYPVLIGQNVLEKTGFLVDPRRNGVAESQEWLTEEEIEHLDDDFFVFENVEQTIDTSVIDQTKVAALYQAMDDADITLKDLMKHIRTQAVLQIEDLG